VLAARDAPTDAPRVALETLCQANWYPIYTVVRARFLAQVGVPPKLYARTIRFNAGLYHKLRCPSRAWSRIANDHDYYDQMHLVHDCRAFTGESPSRFLARTSRPARIPHALRDSKPRATRVTVCHASHPYCLVTPPFGIILDVTPYFPWWSVCGRSRPHPVGGRPPASSRATGMASNRRAGTSDREWNDVENDLRTGWNTYEHRGSSTWEQVKDAVRDAWDRVTGRRHTGARR
jgi:hypothetical protein